MIAFNPVVQPLSVNMCDAVEMRVVAMIYLMDDLSVSGGLTGLTRGLDTRTKARRIDDLEKQFLEGRTTFLYQQQKPEKEVIMAAIWRKQLIVSLCVQGLLIFIISAAFSAERIPKQCEISENPYTKISRDDLITITKLSITAQHEGNYDIAFKCAKFLLDKVHNDEHATWHTKVWAVTLFSDISTKQNKFHGIAELYVSTMKSLPDNRSSHNADLAVLLSHLGDYLYRQKSPLAFNTYDSLIKMKKCNSLFIGSIDVYIERRNQSFDWVKDEKRHLIKSKSCPNVETFLTIIEGY